ncbi:transglutaminase domain-containing protein [Novosphingobium flavum]|uniref:Transglutaminase domain-containing protein n=1 Tax=Novosphingobium flavum TaxID=1778672 RepID=A0A7X1FQL5_9SPHN|nr:transglutaminase-like domain-containing protein [Novosphingobium flavum]MBC2665165.1 transglutaminase domain-containing protein [Novosphingobium flavum]
MIEATGQAFGDRYRTLTEAQVIATMLLEGHAHCPDLAAASAEAASALGRLARAGLGRRQNGNGYLYDPVEVATFVKLAGLREEDDYWERCYVATLRRFVTDLAAETASTRRVRYRRHFDTSRIEAGKTLRLRMPLPLAGRYAGLAVSPELPAEAAGHRVSDGRLEVRVAASGAAEIALGARLDLELGPPPCEGPAEGDLYLRAKEGLVVISPAVAELALRLSGTGTPHRAAVRAFWEYLVGNFIFCPVHYDQVPAEAPLDWVLEKRVYDCQLASALLVGLCRARGIPARLVGGHFLYRRSPTNHYWAEVWLDDSGWTPFDFIGWDLSRGGRDEDWRDRFAGQVDPRLITECLPQSFTGAIGVPIPEIWFMLRTMEGTGAQLRLAGANGETVYRDSVAILEAPA